MSLISILVGIFVILRQPSNGDPGSSVSAIESRAGSALLSRIERTKELHAGYGVYPPYTQEDPITRKVTGFSVDLIEYIAKDLNCRVVWHRFNWNTMAADLKRGEFDVIADPIFQTIPRAREFAFTTPYAYFADGIAMVRRGDTRFRTFESLDSPGIRIAVGQGWASETLVRASFTKATVVPIQTTTDLLQVFNEVLAGRVDVAVADAADAERFAKEHANDVSLLFTNNPPAYMPAGLALQTSDREGAEFLNVALRNLEATGVLEALSRKYGIVTRLAK